MCNKNSESFYQLLCACFYSEVFVKFLSPVECVVERRWKMVDVRKDQMVRGLKVIEVIMVVVRVIVMVESTNKF